MIKRDTLRQELANTPPMLVAEEAVAGAGEPQGQRQDQAAGGGGTAEDAAAQGYRPASGRDRAEEADRGAEASAEGSQPAARSRPAQAERRRTRQPIGAQPGLRAAQGASWSRRTPPSARCSASARLAELLDRLEKVQREQPGLLAEYQNMDRDYGVLRKNYEELLGRLQSANLAQAADTQADKVKLQIVDPPRDAAAAGAPNRLLLVSGVLLAGLGGGIRSPSCWANSTGPSRRSMSCANLGCRCSAASRSLGGRRFSTPDGRRPLQCGCCRPDRRLWGTDGPISCAARR